MAKVHFAQGYVHTKGGKGKLNKSINTLSDALREQADCTACGCDEILGYSTQIDVQDGTLKVLYVWNGTLRVEDYTDQLILNLGQACREREAGDTVTDPQE